MLRLENIKKVYKAGNNEVEALKGISISFRKNEFVSILGPSGCGKTTLLNIIGGLDKASEGDLFIDNISTKNFKDKDWDNYRNKRIGFVFQSYNLIPHQTLLENVELALTIGGFKKEERIKRAKEVLNKVGLEKEYNKKPNQLSGGQCQRVAIARALVNDPEILLADEPTGALDTNTSIQVMELLKEVAKERLVIMVTHNPELAYKYSTRIVKLLDGNIVSDSNEYQEINEEIVENSDLIKDKKSKLSFFQALRLSMQNLISKYKRTILICFAGSIGIIGVGVVLAVSSGVTNYINEVENDMLNGNPLTISETQFDISSLLSSMSQSQQQEIIKDNTEDGVINVDGVLEDIIDQASNIEESLINNTLSLDYLEYVSNLDSSLYYSLGVHYGEDLTNNIYTNISLEGYDESQKMSLSSIIFMYRDMLANVEDSMSELSSLIDLVTYEFDQLPNNNDFVLSQYDVIATTDKNNPLPEKDDELVLVINNNGLVSNLFLAQFGYYSQDEFLNIIYKSLELDDLYDESLNKENFTYEELLNKEFTYYHNDEIYSSNVSPLNPFTYEAYGNNLENGYNLKVKSIIKLKDDLHYGSLSSGIYYSPKLTEKFLNDSENSEITNYLKERPDGEQSFMSTSFQGTNIGVTYNYSYYLNGENFENKVGLVGSSNSMASLMGGNNTYYELSLRDLGGINVPSEIEIYSKDFNTKEEIKDYLNKWNEEGIIVVNDKELTLDDRSVVQVSDNVEVVFSIVNNMTNIVTYALVAFTALSLVVSTVMIAIITYVSVIERVKEIGVIRSLGGRKKDVKNLFNAETFIIGTISGVIGVVVTYLISLIINLIVGSLSGIYTIAALPYYYALLLILVSILLTLISGLIPASLASRKDPVVALRSE